MDHRNRRWLHSRSWASGQRPDGGWLICFGRRDAPIGAKTVLSIRWNSSRIIISIKLLLNTLVHMSTSATCGWQGEGVHVEWGTFLNGDDWGRKPYQPRGHRKGRCEGGRLSKCKVEHKGPTSEPPSNNILERRSQGLSEPPAVPTVLTPDVVGFVEEGLHEAGFAEIRKAVENGGKGPNESHGGASGSAGGCGESEVGGWLQHAPGPFFGKDDIDKDTAKMCFPPGATIDKDDSYHYRWKITMYIECTDQFIYTKV